MKETNWQERYLNQQTGWDIGEISQPLKAYFDQLTDKRMRILVPGGGNGYEAAYLHAHGFEKIFLLDIAPYPLEKFASKHPDFPKEHLIHQDYFEHREKYDLIVEQTFFCAILPSLRKAYARHTHQLLKDEGKLMGVLWSVPLNDDHPPYGGSKEEYRGYFDNLFSYVYFEDCYNSISPRSGRELFLLARKKKVSENIP
ncbi:MAG: SAM-dependent methyltransferase [Verrucomicrobia bacterium]|nr:SAM-dependent methyltransferase [Verrucomicrobiota bacterium]